MSLPNLFSRRKRRANKVGADVYQYDEIPRGFRVQFCQIMRDATGEYFVSDYDSPPNAKIYDEIVRIMRREKKTFHLTGSNTHRNLENEFFEWFLSEMDTDSVLDAIELSCISIDQIVSENIYKFQSVIKIYPADAISEINARFLEAGIGYQYQSGQIIRIDSQVVHAEVVVPALTLLSESRYATAEGEFLAAHTAYRGREYEDCLLHCGKAFESVLKIIGTKRDWNITQNDNASKLVDAAFSSGFVSTEMQAGFTALRGLIAGGVPVLRNRMSGHGAGAVPRNVPAHLAAFQLHQTAAVILFLVEHDNAMP